MPFIATMDGDRVGPTDVPDGEIVVCPACAGEMTTRREHEREGNWVARHFVHRSETSCGGESDRHWEMKHIVLSRLMSCFSVDVGGVEMPVKDRRADALIEFDSSLIPFGKGAIAEVQYKNESKPIEKVTEEYLLEGYTVYWLSEQHFENRSVVLPDPITPWPNALPQDHLKFSPSPIEQIESDPARVTAIIPWDWIASDLRHAHYRGLTREVYGPPFGQEPSGEIRVKIPADWALERNEDAPIGKERGRVRIPCPACDARHEIRPNPEMVSCSRRCQCGRWFDVLAQFNP